MYNLDLFDDFSVTLDDVELWLRTIPRFEDDSRPDAVLDYCRNYDVVNKIIEQKRLGTFESLNDDFEIDKRSLSKSISPLISSRFKPCPHIPFSLYTKRNNMAVLNHPER